jgi:hypothetical protein
MNRITERRITPPIETATDAVTTIFSPKIAKPEILHLIVPDHYDAVFPI